MMMAEDGRHKSSCLWGVDIALLHITRHPGKCPVLLGKAIDADVALNPPDCSQDMPLAGDCTFLYPQLGCPGQSKEAPLEKVKIRTRIILGTRHKAVRTSLSASQQVEECGFAGPTGAH